MRNVLIVGLLVSLMLMMGCAQHVDTSVKQDAPAVEQDVPVAEPQQHDPRDDVPPYYGEDDIDDPDLVDPDEGASMPDDDTSADAVQEEVPDLEVSGSDLDDLKKDIEGMEFEDLGGLSD